MVATLQACYASQIPGWIRSKAKKGVQDDMETAYEEMRPEKDEFLV